MKKMNRLLILVTGLLLLGTVAQAEVSIFENINVPFASQQGFTREKQDAISAWIDQNADIDYAAVLQKAGKKMTGTQLKKPAQFDWSGFTGPIFEIHWKDTERLFIPHGVKVNIKGKTRFDPEKHFLKRELLYYEPKSALSAIYSVDRFYALAQADAPVVFAVVEFLGYDDHGQYQIQGWGTATVSTHAFRIMFIDASTQKVVAWFPFRDTSKLGNRLSLVEDSNLLLVAYNADPWSVFEPFFQLE